MTTYLDISKKTPSKTFKDKSLSAYFKSVIGITPEKLLLMALGIYAHYFNASEVAFNDFVRNPANFNLRKSTFFSNSKNFTEKEIEAFFNLNALPIETLASMLNNAVSDSITLPPI